MASRPRPQALAAPIEPPKSSRLEERRGTCGAGLPALTPAARSPGGLFGSGRTPRSELRVVPGGIRRLSGTPRIEPRSAAGSPTGLRRNSAHPFL